MIQKVKKQLVSITYSQALQNVKITALKSFIVQAHAFKL